MGKYRKGIRENQILHNLYSLKLHEDTIKTKSIPDSVIFQKEKTTFQFFRQKLITIDLFAYSVELGEGFGC